jgi:hypothetical protein
MRSQSRRAALPVAKLVDRPLTAHHQTVVIGATVLSELKTVHAELRGGIAELAALEDGAELDEAALATARLKLTKLSRRRQSLIDNVICPALQDAPQPGAAALADLLFENARLAGKSSEHIGRWTMSAIRADWTGYQRASAEMRTSMLRRIDREAAVLYPLLESEARSAATPTNLNR